MPVKRTVVAFGQSVSPTRSVPWFGMPMMSPGLGLLGELALLGEEEDRVVHGERLARAHLPELHAAPEAARAEAHEGDAVAVVRVHVGLHLEDEAGDARLVGLDGARLGGLRAAAAGRSVTSASSSSRDAEVLERAAEEDRRQVPGAIGGQVERRDAPRTPAPTPRGGGQDGASGRAGRAPDRRGRSAGPASS